MEFDRSLISSLPRSLNFLVRSLDMACNTLMRGKLITDKPDYIEQQEQFSEFFENVYRKPEAIEKFKDKVLKDIYDNNYTDIIEKIIVDNVPKDRFMMNGLEFKFGKFVLPISKIYRNASLHAKENRSAHPPKILLGFYSVMFHTVKKEESKECLDLIAANISSMIEAIEEIAKPPQAQQAGANIFQDLIKNFDISQPNSFLDKLTNNPNMPEELRGACDKVKQIFGSENPIEALEKFAKETTIHAAEQAAEEKEEDIEDESKPEKE